MINFKKLIKKNKNIFKLLKIKFFNNFLYKNQES